MTEKFCEEIESSTNIEQSGFLSRKKNNRRGKVMQKGISKRRKEGS